MKVSTKLRIGFSAMFVLLAFIVIFAASNLGSLRQSFVSVEENIIPNTIEISEIETVADEAYEYAIEYIFHDVEQAKNNALDEMEYLEDLCQNYLSAADPANTTEYTERQSLVTVANSLITNLTNIMNTKENGINYDSIYAFNYAINLPIFFELQRMISDKKSDSLTLLSSIGEEYNQAYSTGIRVLFIIAALIIVIGLLTAYLTTRSITRPLKALHEGTEMISRGNLNYRVGTTSKDEIGELSRSFDKMALSLDVSTTSIDVLNKEIAERKKVEVALRKSQKFNDGLLENTPYQLMVINPDTSIKYVNPKFEEFNGWTLNEVIGKKAPYPWWAGEVKTEDSSKAFQEVIRNESGKGESIARKKNGETYWIDMSWVAVKHEGELQYHLINSVDITERKKREKLQQGENYILTLLGQGAELTEILEAIVQLAEDHNLKIKSSVLLYDPEKHWLKYGAGPNLPDDYREQMKHGAPIGENMGACGTAAYRRERIIVPDIANSPLFLPYPNVIEAATKDNLLACWSQPILAPSGELLGTISNYSNETGEPDTNDLAIMEWSTRIAAIAIERRQAEKALQESEEKFSKAFRSSPNAVAISTLKDGKFIEVNDSFTDLTGYTREEAIGRTVKDLNIWASIKDREKMLKILKREGKVNHREYDFRIKSGKISTWVFSSELIDIDHETCMISMATDITELKQAEHAIKESEEKFSKAFHASPSAITLSILDSGIFIEVNDAFVHLMGYSRKELIGYSAVQFNMWISDEQKEDMVKKIKARIKLNNEEYEYRTKSGEIRTMMVSSEYLFLNGKECALITSNDITDGKRMVEALSESEEKFNKAFHASPDMAAIIDRNDHKFIEANNNFLDFFGIAREKVIGHSHMQKGFWADEEEHNRMLKTIRKHGSIHNEEFRMKSKTGEIRFVLLSAENLNINGKPCSIIMIIDITERKQMEEKLKQTLGELEKSNAQLAATNQELETFSYSVSHDLRSPLRSIDGFSQALLEDYQEILDDTGKDYLQRLRNASQKMGELIDGILKLSRLTRNEMHIEDIDLSALAEEISSRLQEDEPMRHAQFVIKKGLVTQGDPQMLRALMENLVGNAWKFTKNREEARIEFGTKKNGAKTTYYINDNGAGFDMNYADKLFGAFQRLHDASEFSGTGIGLATVQRIINRHGGNIWAEGAVDKGATFYFTLN